MNEGIIMALLGGVIIGIAASIMLVMNGRMAGISGIYNGILQFYRGDVGWRVNFILGLLIGGFILSLVNSEKFFSEISNHSHTVTAIGGILVGFGTVMGTGCTSGHGICGISRFSRRSIVATICFMATGFLAASLFHYFQGKGGL